MNATCKQLVKWMKFWNKTKILGIQFSTTKSKQQGISALKVVQEQSDYRKTTFKADNRRQHRRTDERMDRRSTTELFSPSSNQVGKEEIATAAKLYTLNIHNPWERNGWTDKCMCLSNKWKTPCEKLGLSDVPTATSHKFLAQHKGKKRS